MRVRLAEIAKANPSFGFSEARVAGNKFRN